MKEKYIEKQEQVNILLSELLLIKDELEEDLEKLTDSELDDFENFIETDLYCLKLTNVESELIKKLNF